MLQETLRSKQSTKQQFGEIAIVDQSAESELSYNDVADSAKLPQRPAFGEIDYYRHIEGENQQWMQQLTPRQGGDSMLGQHDIEDGGQDYVHHPYAEYDMVSAPPTRQGEPQSQFVHTAGSFENMQSQMNITQNDSELFHARSDAAMEI